MIKEENIFNNDFCARTIAMVAVAKSPVIAAEPREDYCLWEVF